VRAAPRRGKSTWAARVIDGAIAMSIRAGGTAGNHELGHRKERPAETPPLTAIYHGGCSRGKKSGCSRVPRPAPENVVTGVSPRCGCKLTPSVRERELHSNTYGAFSRANPR